MLALFLECGDSEINGQGNCACKSVRGETYPGSAELVTSGIGDFIYLLDWLRECLEFWANVISRYA